MNQFITILIFVVCFNRSYSQERFEIATDTTFALGVVKAGRFIGKTNSSSGIYSDKYISDPTAVLIIGAKRGYDDDKSFEIYINGKIRYVRATDIDTHPDNFDKIYNWSDSTKDSFREHGIALGDRIYEEKLEEASSWLKSKKSSDIVIFKKSVYDESEYTDGTGIKYEVMNVGKKTIKYITFNFTGYNAVDDKVSILKSRKGIGPIDPGESGGYTFEYVWFTDIVEYAKTNSIKLQFKDGSIRTLTNISSITVPDKIKQILEEIEED
ncbi:hypothetical protein [Sphingobacterium multivorum]|uniref:hypothetical protein n=1 Tax=Sphingobacterium multivorum TaxID=28454 RepID=UPI0028982688|nr:hypothetical protein [Sphingobacterium multivorum]